MSSDTVACSTLNRPVWVSTETNDDAGNGCKDENDKGIGRMTVF